MHCEQRETLPPINDPYRVKITTIIKPTRGQWTADVRSTVVGNDETLTCLRTPYLRVILQPERLNSGKKKKLFYGNFTGEIRVVLT